jgi:hypothetical protein
MVVCRNACAAAVAAIFQVPASRLCAKFSITVPGLQGGVRHEAYRALVVGFRDAGVFGPEVLLCVATI